jgi:predicted transcriptional regulator
MSNIKVTKADNYQALLNLAEVAAHPELVEFINHELALLAKKSTNRKPSKSQETSNTLRDIVLEVLNTADSAITIAEIQEADSRLKVFNGENISNQRIAAILTRLIGEGIVFKQTIKRRNYYSTSNTFEPEV